MDKLTNIGLTHRSLKAPVEIGQKRTLVADHQHPTLDKCTFNVVAVQNDVFFQTLQCIALARSFQLTQKHLITTRESKYWKRTQKTCHFSKAPFANQFHDIEMMQCHLFRSQEITKQKSVCIKSNSFILEKFTNRLAQ